MIFNHRGRVAAVTDSLHECLRWWQLCSWCTLFLWLLRCGFYILFVPQKCYIIRCLDCRGFLFFEGHFLDFAILNFTYFFVSFLSFSAQKFPLFFPVHRAEISLYALKKYELIIPNELLIFKTLWRNTMLFLVCARIYFKSQTNNLPTSEFCPLKWYYSSFKFHALNFSPINITAHFHLHLHKPLLRNDVLPFRNAPVILW